MRKKNAIKNTLTSVSSNIITIIIGLFAQFFFLKFLGAEYLGLNGLFSNVIAMLGIAELGIGNAIIYNLYKPLAENNKEKIKSLMHFYKKSYYLIGIIVLIIGIILIPFLPLIVDFSSVTVPINVYFIYILFLLESVSSYFISYKRSILYADQKSYYINLIHIGYTIILNILQLLILFKTKNYYLFLIIKIIVRLIENYVVSKIAEYKYRYINEKNVVKIDKETEKNIFVKIKALFFHKIGSFIVLGTDNIIISKMLGIVVVGLYSNYYLIINAVQTVFNQVIKSTTASVGNLLVTETKEKSFSVFKKIRFLNFWIATFSSTCILVIMDSFIKIWIGKQYLLPRVVLIVLVFNLYQKLMRSSYGSFKEAAGIYYEDRFVPLVESILNIVVSVICCHYMGLAGVFVGTIVSGLALWCYSYPKFVYKKLFDRKYRDYIKETLGYIFCFLLISSLSYMVSLIITFDNNWLRFISNVLIASILSNLLIIIIFCKTECFDYYLNLVLKKKQTKEN